MTDGQRAHLAYLASRRWQAIRRWRRGWDVTCRVCRSDERLEVHHASYRWKGRFGWLGWALEWLDCVTLCEKCHEAIHRAHRINDFSD